MLVKIVSNFLQSKDNAHFQFLIVSLKCAPVFQRERWRESVCVCEKERMCVEDIGEVLLWMSVRTCVTVWLKKAWNVCVYVCESLSVFERESE